MIFEILTWVEILISPIIFVILLFITAPYGRHTRKGFGLKIENRLGWFLMELPAQLIPLVFYTIGFYYYGFSMFATIALLMWEVHYIYRVFIYTWTLRGTKKNFPLSIVFGAIGFNFVNGLINSNFAFLDSKNHGDFNLGLNHIVGMLVFIVAFTLTSSSDTIIKDLRTKNDKNYYIPQKGLFRLISNPHYLGEILEWCGWAIFTWSLPGLAFAVFTFANLFPRAISNHNWYKSTFLDYPKKRKIIIPFIF